MKHDFPFDPTYGYELDALRRVGCPAEPADFAQFWRRSYEEVRAMPLKLSRRAIESAWADHDVFEIEFDSLGGVRIGGWLTIPRGRRIERGVVVGHGYSGRAAPDPHLPGPAAAAIFPCARGFNRSRNFSIPDVANRHVLHGIESRETYVHRGCAADIWAAASALCEIFPDVSRCLDYLGASFGGGIGAMAIPWDARFRRAFLDVPSFGNHPLRVTLPCVGSGEAVREYMKTHDSQSVLDVLAYFDAAIAPRHVTIPTFVAAAVFDPAVLPPGQFAVHNAIVGEKELFVRKAAHFDWDGADEEDAELHRLLHGWFGG